MSGVLAFSVLDGINIAGAVLGFGCIFGLVWLAARGDPERDAEESARLYYDRHGRWPED